MHIIHVFREVSLICVNFDDSGISIDLNISFLEVSSERIHDS